MSRDGTPEQQSWRDEFTDLESRRFRGMRAGLRDAVWDELPAESRPLEKALLSAELSRVRGGEERGLKWLFDNPARRAAVERALNVSEGTLDDMRRRIWQPVAPRFAWYLPNPRVLVASPSEFVAGDDGARRGGRGRGVRRPIGLDDWVRDLRAREAEHPDGPAPPPVHVMVHGPRGSGRAWIVERLRGYGVAADVEAAAVDAVAPGAGAATVVQMDVLPWGPEDVLRLVEPLKSDDRARVERALVEPWRTAPLSLPDELRRPARLLPLVEQAIRGVALSWEPAAIRRVELALRVSSARERVPTSVLPDPQTAVEALATWWVKRKGPRSLAGQANEPDVIAALTQERTPATISRGDLPATELFAALEGDVEMRQALLARLAERAGAAEVLRALVEAGILNRGEDLVGWGEDGQALARLLLSARYDVLDDAVLADLVWSHADRRVLVDSAIAHGHGVSELVAAMEEHRGRSRIGVHLAALELALTLGPAGVRDDELSEPWFAALYAVALGVVPGEEHEQAEWLVSEVSRVFERALPRFGADLVDELEAEVDPELRAATAPFARWELADLTWPLRRLCPWQLPTPARRGESRVYPSLLDDAPHVIVARARRGEVDAIEVLVDWSSYFDGDPPRLEDIAAWSAGVKL
ncbi:MAG: hypothetical protein KC635_29010, partial [Myxococcales bacterium]|nr:hypothetical protein [Myxococcales bacterium]